MAQRKRLVGNLSDLDGEIKNAGSEIYKGYTAEQVSLLLTQITFTLHPESFSGRCLPKGLHVIEEENAQLLFARKR